MLHGNNLLSIGLGIFILDQDYIGHEISLFWRMDYFMKVKYDNIIHFLVIVTDLIVSFII